MSGDLIIYRALNGELALSFPSSEDRNKFTEELGSYSLGRIYSEQPTNLYIPVIIDNDNSFIIFNSFHLRDNFISLINDNIFTKVVAEKRVKLDHPSLIIPDNETHAQKNERRDKKIHIKSTWSKKEDIGDLC